MTILKPPWKAIFPNVSFVETFPALPQLLSLELNSRGEAEGLAVALNKCNGPLVLKAQQTLNIILTEAYVYINYFTKPK